MKSNERMLTLKWFTAITFLAALAVPARLAAQGANQQHHQYKVIDVGTFGGPQSFVNEFFDGGTASGDINPRGLMVGNSATSTFTVPTSNGLVCGGLPFVFHAFKLQEGVVTDLGALQGADNCSGAIGSNANGEIVGNSESSEIDPVTGVKQSRAVLWKNDQITDVGTFGGGEAASVSINNRGQVVGVATNAIRDPLACLGVGTRCRAFLWQDGLMQDLGSLGGPEAWAVLVNERGQVAGLANTNFAPSTSCFLARTTDPFLWENGRMKDLGTLGGTCGVPLAMNNRGQVVGHSNLVGDSADHPFLWPGTNDKMQDLGTLGGSFGQANAINEAGQIVGFATVAGDQAVFAFLWEKGEITNLGALGGDPCSVGTSVNSKRQVVGYSATCDFITRRAFLWENGSMADLNALISPKSGLQLTLAEDINDRGEIAVNATPSGCVIFEQCGHAVLLIPCDENHPNVEGCDYSLVDTSTTAEVRPTQTIQSSAEAAPNPKLSPAQTMTRFRSMMASRNRRWGNLHGPSPE